MIMQARIPLALSVDRSLCSATSDALKREAKRGELPCDLLLAMRLSRCVAVFILLPLLLFRLMQNDGNSPMKKHNVNPSIEYISSVTHAV